jgi:succinyl-diaminopimelate desuccinylase
MRASALAALCLELVAVPSVTGDEAEVADLVEAFCRALPGVAVERIGHSVVARSGPADEPALAFVGHTDTVPPWPGHEARRDGLRVIGRGASDMKGGDAAILAVLAHAAERDLPAVAVLYSGVEGPHEDNGIHDVLGRSHLLGTPPFAFVAEPTGGLVHAGCVGVVNADVRFRGRTGHSARPWEAVNAITAAAPFLARAAAVEVRPSEVEGLRFADTLAIVGAEGGIARNVVPDRFTVQVNMRFAPGRTLAEATADLDLLVAGEAEVVIVDGAEAAPPQLSDPTLRAFLRHTGLEVRPKQAWTDVATLAAAGIPAANYGPGDPAQAHQPGEWVDGAAIAEVAATLAGFLGER